MLPRTENDRRTFALCLVFLASGFPALIYQLVWQRSLFAIYGVNIESITIVVAAFMLGLGLGSLAGGALSKKAGLPYLLIFGLAEISAGLFGLVSLKLFSWVGDLTLGAGVWTTGMISFCLVLFPTVLMGATLPLLVAFLVKVSKNVGRSVGILYFVNTVGSAIACFVTAFFLMRLLGMRGTILLASLIDVVVGIGAIAYHLRLRNVASSDEAESDPDNHAPETVAPLSFRLGLVLSAAAGFIALSYEIVWARVFSLASEGAATAFPFLLGSYLLGIAGGSAYVGRHCERDVSAKFQSYLRTLALFVLAVNVAGYALVPLLGQVTRFSDYHFGYILVALAAGGLGAIFPLVSHLCVSPNSKAGQKIGYLYMANILGSTLGTLLTGFVLLDVAGLGWSSTLLCLSGGLVGLALLHASGINQRQWLLSLSGAGIFSIAIVTSQGFVFDGLSEMLILKRDYTSSFRFADIVENKSGHIAVDNEGKVYGGGKYDGKFNTDLVVDTNMIVRPFSLSAFHPKIEHILVIGVATGAWTQVLAHHPQAKSLTAVEINDGYLQLTRKYEVTKSLADNPKVKFIIDDGRRWLRRNPDKKFDLIVANSTYNWRGMATQLLSKEFLELIREHLNPGGIYFYNTTRAQAVLQTGATTFPYGFRFINHLVLSDSEIKIDTDHLRSILLQYEIDGKKVIDPGKAEDNARLYEIIDQLGQVDLPGPNKYGVETRAHLIERTAPAGIVTDDNMGTEWIVR